MGNNGTKTWGHVGVLSVGLASSMLALGCAEGTDDHDTIEERNAEIVANLLEAGFAEEDIEVRESVRMGDDLTIGEPELQVFVDGDTHVTLEASRELVGDDGDGNTFRLWRTSTIVNNPSTICLAKVTTAQAPYGSYVLTNSMISGVNMARDNYAALASFGLTFVLGNASLSSTGVLSHSIPGCTYSIFIYQVNGGAGGSSGFPSGGAPYNQIQLNSGLAGWNLDIHEHVATHEIGHAIGLRHSDWKTRSSCGQNTNEGQSGAVQIPGTVDQTTNSIMAACFGAGALGEFLGQDTLALTTLY